MDTSEFNRPVWHEDRDGNPITVIPKGFAEIIPQLTSGIQGLKVNWDTNDQIEVFIEILQSLKEQ